jgi:hypothetical protein
VEVPPIGLGVYAMDGKDTSCCMGTRWMGGIGTGGSMIRGGGDINCG